MKFNRAALGTVGAVVLLAGGGAAIALRDDRPPPEPRLAGAELIGGNGPEMYSPLVASLGELRLDETDHTASQVLADPSGNLLVVTATEACFNARLDASDCDGSIIRYDPRLRFDIKASHVGPPGALASHSDGTALRVAGGSSKLLATPEDWAVSRRLIGREESFPITPYTGAYLPDGIMVLADTHEPWLVTRAPDGTVSNLLTPAGGAPAPLHLDTPTARLTVVALPDGRIVFATNAPDDAAHDGRVFIIDGDTLVPLELTTDNPVRRIFPGTDGTLLALDGPHISEIDPDTGATTSLIDLSELTDELGPADDLDNWPQTNDQISATVLGDDLVFTADSKIWRLSDAFA